MTALGLVQFVIEYPELSDLQVHIYIDVFGHTKSIPEGGGCCFYKTSFQVRMDLYKLQKQSRDENFHADYSACTNNCE